MNNFVRCILTLMLAVLVVAGGAGCTSKAKRAYHERRADKFYAAGQFDRAEIEYLNVLRNDPEVEKAYARLGDIYYQQGRFQSAGPFLLKASTLATNDTELRLKLAYVHASFGDYKDAHDDVEFVLARQPQSDDASLLLADIVLTPRDVTAARAQLQALAQNGDRASYEVALATLAYHERDPNTAGACLKKAIALDPKSPAALEAMGAYYASLNDRANAEKYYKASADLSDARSARRMMYARFILQNGDAEGARQILQADLKEAPDYVPALMGMAEISITQKKYDEAQNYNTQILSRDPDNFDGLMFEARLDMARNKTTDAVADLERMSKLYPQASGVQCQLGYVYAMSGDDTKATICLNRALELDPTFTEAMLLLAQVQIRDRNPDPAIVSLSNLIQKQPQLENARLLLADAYRLRGRASEALAVYQALEQAFPKDPKLPLLTGADFLEMKDNASARAAFEHARQMAPDSLDALTQLVSLDLAETNFTAATQEVDREMQKNAKSLATRLLQAQVLIAEKKTSEAEAALLEADKLDPGNPNTSLMLAQLYDNSNQDQKALSVLDAATASNPLNIPAWMLEADIHDRENDHAAAAATYEKILQIDPKYSPALNNLAYQYSEFLDKLDRAYDLAQQARALRPFDPATGDTLGWILLKRGSYTAALNILQDSVQKLSTVPEVQFHYGMANYMTDNEAGARAALQQALQAGTTFRGRDESQLCLSLLDINAKTADAAAQSALEKRVADKPNDPVAQRRLGAIYERKGQAEKAIASYKEVLEVDPQNLTTLIALARLYAPTDATNAMSMAKAANQIAPDNVEVTHIMGQIAYQAGDFKLAASWLQQTAANQPNNAQAQFDFALAAYGMGNIAQVKAALDNALSLNLPPAQSKEAQTMLNMIGLAENPAQAVAASQQVAEVLKNNPNYVPALMAQAVIGQQNSDLALAAADGEKILSQRPDFAPAQRLLAIVYSSDPTKASKAYELAMKARTNYPDDPILARATAIIVFQQGDFSRATRLLEACAANSDSDAEIYFYLGSAQFQLNELPASKRNLQKALTLKLSGAPADAAKKMLAQIK